MKQARARRLSHKPVTSQPWAGRSWARRRRWRFGTAPQRWHTPFGDRLSVNPLDDERSRQQVADALVVAGHEDHQHERPYPQGWE